MKEIKDKDVICLVKNSATLAGSLFTAHASQVHIDLPTLTETDKEVCFLLPYFCSCDFAWHLLFQILTAHYFLEIHMDFRCCIHVAESCLIPF